MANLVGGGRTNALRGAGLTPCADGGNGPELLTRDVHPLPLRRPKREHSRSVNLAPPRGRPMREVGMEVHPSRTSHTVVSKGQRRRAHALPPCSLGDVSCRRVTSRYTVVAPHRLRWTGA
jgi:hypothetical protein